MTARSAHAEIFWARGARVLYLLTERFGGQGGIAQFYRDLLRAICSHPSVSEVMAFPRYVRHQIGDLPSKLKYDVRSATCKLRYVTSVMLWLFGRPPIDLIICTHLNLQPLAVLARSIVGAPLIIVLHGVEAWPPPRSWMRRFAVRRADWVAAVSRFTLKRFLEWAPVSSEQVIITPCVDVARF